MKKMFVLFIVFTVASLLCCAQSPNSKKNLPEPFKFLFEHSMHIYGDVKEIHIKTFDAFERDGEIVKSGLLISNNIEQMPSSYFFNTSGQIVYAMGNWLSGDWAGVFHYENEKLRTIYWITEDTLMRKYDYKYPEEGKVNRISSRVLDDHKQNLNAYDLDENGHIVKYYRYSLQNEKEIQTTIYKIGDDGTIIDKKVINPEGKVTAHYDKWEYNDKNNLVKVHQAILDGEKVNRYDSERQYEYDDKGNWIKQTIKNPNPNNIRVIEREIVYFE